MKGLTILLILFTGIIFSAPNKKFEAELSALLEQYQLLKSAEVLQTAAEAYEELAEKYPGEWLPKYYAAQHRIFAAEYTSKKDNKLDQLTIADKTLTQAIEQFPDNSELLALKAFYLIKKGRTTGNYNTEAIEILIKQAQQADSKNPRAYMVSGIYWFYQNSYTKARNELGQALDLFKNKTKDLYPSWGRSMTESLYYKI